METVRSNVSKTGNPIFAIIAGLRMFFVGSYLLYNDNVLVKWETLTAKIDKSFIDKYKSSDQETLWRPVMEYTYIYNGQEYLGVYRGPGASFISGAQRFVSDHAVVLQS